MTEPERAAEFRRLYAAGVAAAQRRGSPGRLGLCQSRYDRPDLWCDVATKLAKEGEETAALDHFKTALSVSRLPGIRTGIFNNVATIYAKRGQLAEAEEMLDQALKEDANNADALTNLGQVRKWQRRLDASDRYTDRALAINPWHSEAAFLKALNTLDRGDYVKGFELYESRWRSKTNGIRKIECFQPEWPGPGSVDWRTGKPFRKLFVYCEQGAGDVFLMMRYTKLIREAGLSQFWALKQGMAGLLGSMVDGWSEQGEQPEDLDLSYPERESAAYLPDQPSEPTAAALR